MSGVCPACATVPPVEPSMAGTAPDVVLHLPDIHCAACIASVEETLAALPGVRDARVNLTLKRAFVSGPHLAPEPLVEALAGAGHRAQELDNSVLAGQGDEGRDWIMRIGIAGFAMMNVMLLSVAVWSGAADSTARLFHLISAMIALPAIAFSGRPFFASAAGALRHRRLNMDVPISLAILLAAAVSLLGALTGSGENGWFDAALALTFFLLVGRYLDHRGRHAARSAAAELAALDVPQAMLVEESGDRLVRAETLKAGDVIRLRPGDRLPADGTVMEGRSDIDRSALTGESRAEPAGAGDAVAAGEVNLSGPLLVRVVRAGRDTALSRLADLVATAESQRSRFTAIADRAAAAYAPLVHLAGAVAFVLWWSVTADGWRALDVAISVLVITCPCALGLAAPAVSTVATSRLFRQGLLVKSRTALERLSEVDMVVFDKTGTLTTGAARLTALPDDEALALAAGLALGSAHPYSRAVIAAAEGRGLAPPRIGETRELPGRGIEGRVKGRRVRLGNPEWIGMEAADGVALDDGSGTPLLLTFEEEIRPDAADCVADLRAAGYDVALLSGDAPDAVARIAGRLGIEVAEARMTPEGKADWLRARTDEGRRTLMVGDGLNDAGALAVAHASLSPGSALEAARSLADVVLLADRLAPVASLLATARGCTWRMKQNIALAVLYNLVAVPVAFAGLATPLVAAIAMSTSSLTVTLNAMRRMP